jgi:glycosyltransferase involved in cell wall biosynthesis
MNTVEFWSSVENTGFQKGLIRALASSGWEAAHHFEVSQASYWNSRSRMARLGLRFRSYAAYPARVVGHFLGARNSRVGVVCTNTFFAPWVAAVAAGRRGTPVVHWVFDLYPDVLVTAGAMGPDSLGGRIVRGIVRATFHRAAANVFLGPRLREYAERQFGPIPRATVIPVGCDAEPFRGLYPASRAPAAPLRMLYSGNMGKMHDVETILAALQIGLPERCTIAFRGNGSGFRRLETMVRSLGLGGERVSFGGNLLEGDWISAMSGADVGLVTMRHGAEGVVMPSKTYSSLAAGQAVLAICPLESDLADTVGSYECGWVIKPGDGAGLAALWRQMVEEPDDVLLRRRNAWQAGQTAFDQRILARSWKTVLDSIQQTGG